MLVSLCCFSIDVAVAIVLLRPFCHSDGCVTRVIVLLMYMFCSRDFVCWMVMLLGLLFERVIVLLS